MGVAVVDTSVLVAVADADDRNYAVAKEIVGGIDHGELPSGRVTNYVVLETLNWINERGRRGIAMDLYERLDTSAGFEVVHCPQVDFADALETFDTFDELAFGDATIAAYARREDVGYVYSFDDDFDAVEGIVRLETPSNPFSKDG